MRRLAVTAVPIALLAAVLCGCGTPPSVVHERRSLLSDLTDCAPEEIGMHRGRRGTWTATCQGTVYSCTGSPDVVCTDVPQERK